MRTTGRGAGAGRRSAGRATAPAVTTVSAMHPALRTRKLIDRRGCITVGGTPPSNPGSRSTSTDLESGGALSSAARALDDERDAPDEHDRADPGTDRTFLLRRYGQAADVQHVAAGREARATEDQEGAGGDEGDAQQHGDLHGRGFRSS